MGAWLAQPVVRRTVMAGRSAGMAAHHDTWMIEDARRPGRIVSGDTARVTSVALGARRRNVRNRHGLSVLGEIGTTMAGRTVAGGQRRIGARVIHRARAETDESVGVAGIALGTGGNVRHRFGQGVDRDIATAVTSRALAGCTGVVHAGWLEGGVVAMAVAALASGRYM